MNDFERDNLWQQGVRDAVLAPGFYDKYALNGRYVFMDKGRLATILQRRFAVDTILQSKDGLAVCIEEKLVRWPKSGRPYSAFCLETHSCTVPGRESDGWMKYAEADYLLYGFSQNAADDQLIIYLIEFQPLRKWFWPLEQTFEVFGPQPTLNRTMGRKVPIAAVRNNVKTYRMTVTAPVRFSGAA